MALIKDIFHPIYDDAIMPKRMTKGSAGFDLCVYGDYKLFPKIPFRIKTGIGLNNGFFSNLYGQNIRVVGKIYLRSGWSFKNKVILINGVGIIDMDYTYNEDLPKDQNNELKFQLLNIGEDIVSLEHGERIGQIVFQPYLDFDTDAQSIRSGGFGSTDAIK